MFRWIPRIWVVFTASIGSIDRMWLTQHGCQRRRSAGEFFRIRCRIWESGGLEGHGVPHFWNPSDWSFSIGKLTVLWGFHGFSPFWETPILIFWVIDSVSRKFAGDLPLEGSSSQHVPHGTSISSMAKMPFPQQPWLQCMHHKDGPFQPTHVSKIYPLAI